MPNKLKYHSIRVGGITKKQAKTVKRTITIPSIVSSYINLLALENRQSFSETASRLLLRLIKEDILENDEPVQVLLK